MKKGFQKVLVLLLTLSMLMSMMAVPGFADDGSVTAAPGTSVAATSDESAVNALKEVISKLPNSSDVTEADRETILAAVADFEALSAEDQAEIDDFVGPNAYDTGQPYGRILESAYWGLLSLEEVDNTTTLAPGTYDATTTPALSSSYSKGKSTSRRQKPWSVSSISVDENHNVTATLTVESDSYSGVVYQGKTYEKTNTSGNSTFEIPIDLNTTFYFSGVSTSMPAPIAFSVTTEIEEPAAPAEPEKTELEITNKTGMFKGVTAYLTTEGEQEYLVMALSGSGYHELYKGTYEQAVANGDGSADKGNDSWIHGYTNEDGLWEFKIPMNADDSFVPCVAISNSYYTKYLNGQNTLERAYYPRQFTLDREAKTLVTDDYNETADFAVTSNVADFKVNAKASTTVVGGPNSNNYKVAPTLVMEDGTYDKVTYPSVVSGKLSEASADLTDGSFAISLLNAPNMAAFQDKTPIEMKFHVAEDAPYAEAGTDVVRTVTIDKMAKTIEINGDALTEKTPDVLADGTYTASKVSTDVTTEASGMIMVTKATVVIKDGKATAVVTMKGTGADRFYVSDTATKETIIAEAIAEEQKEVNGEFGNLLGGLKMEGESAYTFWPVPITLGQPTVYAARSASHFSKQDIKPEEYYYVHDFQIDAKDLQKVSDSTELPITEQQEAQRYLNQYFMDGKVVTSATAAAVTGKNANVTIPYYNAEGAKINSVIFKMAESDQFRSGWFVDSSILNSAHFSSSNLKKIRYPEGSNGTVTFYPKATYRDEGMTFTATLKLYPADAKYNQYDSEGVYYDKEPLAEQTFTFTVEPLPGDRHVTIDVVDVVSKEPIEEASVAVTKDADGSAVEATEGTYALAVPGTYTIKASAAGYVVPGTENTEYVQTEYTPKKDGEKVTINLIKAEQSKNTITFDLKDQMGDAVVNPAITVYPWNDKEAVVAPEADGSYKLYNGTNYGYTVKAEGYEDKTGTIKPSEDATVDVVVNKYLSEQKFTFRVYDSKTNETIDNVNLTVKYGPSGEDESTYAEAQPDENGVYTIPIDNRVVAYGHKLGYEDSSLGVWSLGFDPLKECSFSLKAYPELTVDKTNAGMMKPAEKAYLAGEKTVLLPMENDSFSAVFVGDGREVDETKAIALAEDNTFTFDVEEFDKEMMIAFKSKKNGNWLNKKVTVSKENGTLVIVDDKADYTKVDAAKAAIPEDLSIYTEESVKAVNDAVAAVKTGKNSAEQAAVDAMAKTIDDAVAALEKKPADYSAVEAAKAKVPADLSIYTDATAKAVTDAVAAVEEGKKIDEQDAVDAMAKAIDDAVKALELKPADYSAVEAAKAKVPADMSIYTDATAKAVTDAVAAVEEGKKIDEQDAVDAMAKAIEDAVAALRVDKFQYDGTEVQFIKRDGETFGMWSAQEGSTFVYRDGKLEISIIPSSSKKTYSWMHWGGINEELTKDVTLAEDGRIVLSLDADKCGWAYPVAPIKTKDDTKTTGSQYYLAVPTLDKLAADYTEVDAALKNVPADLNIYTDATKKAVEDAVAAVDRTKKADHQADVDAMAKAIDDAVAALEKAPTAKKTVVGGNTMNFKQNTYTDRRLPSVARPYQLTLTARLDKKMLLQWTNCNSLGADIDGYVIMRRVGSEKAYTEYTTVPKTQNYFYDNGISKANQNYYYIVLGYKTDASGNRTISSDSMSVVGVRYDSTRINPHEYPAKKVAAQFKAKFGLPTINAKSITLKVGQTYNLKLTYPKNSFSTWTRWRSDNSAYATVNSSGKVTAKSPGKVLISGRTPNGRDIRCTVTVVAP